MKNNVFFVGIGGTGLSAIARLLKEKGYMVSGSDQEISSSARDLISDGITVFKGHEASHITNIDLVIRSSAIQETNPEVQAAIKAGIPVYKRSDILGELMEDQKGIAVAGTHGKTTTTAMIATMIDGLGLDPSYIIGSVSKNLGKNAHFGHGEYFVIEADEYDRMFLGLKPYIGIITNLEHDHPDCYPTLADYQQAFLDFVQRISRDGYLFVCGDDHGIDKIIPSINFPKIFTYGLSDQSDYRAIDLRINEFGSYTFRVEYKNSPTVNSFTEIRLKVPGKHNVLNALAAIAIGHQLNFDSHKSSQVLAEFSGTGRRFEVVGEVNGITIIDDYAHHPTEISATLQAARMRYPDREIWAVWQPHTYSRTKTLFNEFVSCFSEADHVIISQVYASREKFDGFSAESFVQAIDQPNVSYIPTLNEITSYLLKNLSTGDVLFVFSAGDAVQVTKDVYSSLSQKEKEK